MPICYFCGTEIEIIFKIGRLEECPRCGKYLHSCMQCKFYDRSYHNDCRENQAPPVGDKEDANFCEFFQLGRDAVKEKEDAASAKAGLEALFKKG